MCTYPELLHKVSIFHLGKDQNCIISLFALTKCKEKPVYYCHAQLGQFQYLLDKTEQLHNTIICSCKGFGYSEIAI
ncbi:hypothetical protein RchiOBHm_Chr1g0342821 [Rosa chinensis]|uniref:Uncharacterized protein n=1 Tax=Rosa chinensis TaxID=74649 RepID=A0A2P6SE49_ROSCH|nr:hypothetical protein RchiOBHm_Chr1g0342821 [Rosa chinensis]